MKQINTSLKTMGIKARLANIIRTDLYKKTMKDFTTGQKEALFDKWFAEALAMHWELNAYKRKRKAAKELYEARVKRGYKFKKRTSKAEYEAMMK